MASPFNTPAARPADCATDAQIMRAIVPAIESGKWNRQDPQKFGKYISRVAVLNTMIGWALAPMSDDTPPAISRVINGTVGRSSSYGERVNALLAHCATEAAPEMAYAYAPLTKAGASKLIEWLFSLDATAPKADAELPVTGDRPSAEVVPAGRYAIDTEDGAVNATAFYKVDRPTEGKWAGFVFVKLMVSDEEQRMSRAAGDAILRKIAAVGAENAAARYGHELGECGLCGRTLTNDESRARGIGPICAAKAGW